MIKLAELTRFLERLPDDHCANDEATVATNIPELGEANPDHFGIGMVMSDGQEFPVGGVDQAFIIPLPPSSLPGGLALR